MTGEQIHWYLADKCNLDCLVCFKPNIKYRASAKQLQELAHVLVKNKIKKVILTGGEPTLEKRMDEVLEILKEGNIFVSLHTNGTLLDERRVSELAGLVDDIALPIDSTRKRTQNEIRCEKFLPVLDKLPSLAKAITGKGMLLGYHTVFTMKNCNDLPAIYHFINKHHFDYWRIYEFNDYLAVTSLINQKLCLTRKDQEKFQRRKRSILMLRGTDGWHEDAKDELSPIYNRESEKFQHDKDLRIQFVAISGVKEAYAFLDNTGRISTYTCLSGTTRFELGNILYEGFGTVMRRLSRLDAKAEELSRS